MDTRSWIRDKDKTELSYPINLIHHETGFRADIYLAGKDQLHHWGLTNRKSVRVEDEAVWVAPAEYVILRKLEYYPRGAVRKTFKGHCRHA